MDILKNPRLYNWWCVRCQRWIASEDMNEAKKCRECGTKCQYIEYEPEASR